jgi:hypothetical protein
MDHHDHHEDPRVCYQVGVIFVLVLGGLLLLGLLS